MAYKQPEFRTVPEGGTNKGSFTEDTVICAGVTSTSTFQNVADTGTTHEVLTSQGAGSLPAWAELVNATFFEPLASDPSSPTVGQVWYNTTSNEFKGFLGGGGSAVWVIKAPLNHDRYRGVLVGTGGDSLLFGDGITTSIHTNTLTSERYDGTLNTWTVRASTLIVRQDPSGVGSADDALCVGGLPGLIGGGTNSSVRYDGGTNTWTSRANYPHGLYSAMAAANGDATDAFVWGGQPSAGFSGKDSQKYDGGANTWTAKADILATTNWHDGAGGGTFTSALSFGGTLDGGGPFVFVQEYDGNTNIWTTKANTIFPAENTSGGGVSGSSCLKFGGVANGVRIANTEEYSGISNTWSVKPSMNIALDWAGGSGTTLDALRAGGDIGGSIETSSERYNAPTDAVVIFDLT